MRLDARWVVALLWCAMGLFASGSASGAAGEPSGELIARSQITTTGEPSCTLVQAPLAKDKLDALSEMLRQDIADGRIPGAGLAIHQAGKRVYTFAAGRVGHNRDGAVGRHTRFRLFSMTKPLISVAVLQLVEAGRLKLSDPLTRYLPVFSNIRLEGPGGTWLPASGPITIRDLLRHTSGLPYGFFGRGRVREILKAAELYRGGRTAEETMVVLVKAGLEHSPGSVWEYGHSNTVLAAVLEAIHQKPLADVLHASLFAPLAMTSTSFFVPTAVPDDVVAGTPKALARMRERPAFDGGVGAISTVDDYTRFARMLLNAGTLDGVRVLSAAMVGEMTMNQLRGSGTKPGVAFTQGKYFLPGRGYGFGYGVAVRIDDANIAGRVGDYWWGGYGGSYFWVDPTNEMTVVFMIDEHAMRRHYRQVLRRMVYEALDD